MKKVLLGVTAAALAAVMCMGFMACDSDDDSNPSGNNPDSSSGEDYSDENNGSDNSEEITGEAVLAKAKNIVSEKVTAAQWEAAFAEEYFENGQCITYMIGETGLNEDGSKNESWGRESQLCIASYKGTKMYKKFIEEAEGESISDDIVGGEYELYLSVENNEVIEYRKNENEEWQTDNNTDWPVPESSYGGAILIHDELFKDFVKDSYDSFTYSEEEKGYIFTDNAGTYDMVLVVKFTDGKLSAFILEEGDVGYYDKMAYTFTYGGQKEIALPEVSA